MMHRYFKKLLAVSVALAIITNQCRYVPVYAGEGADSENVSDGSEESENGSGDTSGGSEGGSYESSGGSDSSDSNSNDNSGSSDSNSDDNPGDSGSSDGNSGDNSEDSESSDSNSGDNSGNFGSCDSNSDDNSGDSGNSDTNSGDNPDNTGTGYDEGSEESDGEPSDSLSGSDIGSPDVSSGSNEGSTSGSGGNDDNFSETDNPGTDGAGGSGQDNNIGEMPSNQNGSGNEELQDGENLPGQGPAVDGAGVVPSETPANGNNSDQETSGPQVDDTLIPENTVPDPEVLAGDGTGVIPSLILPLDGSDGLLALPGGTEPDPALADDGTKPTMLLFSMALPNQASSGESSEGTDTALRANLLRSSGNTGMPLAAQPAPVLNAAPAQLNNAPETNSANFTIENGVLTGCDHGDEGHVEIPNTVTEIGRNVFYNDKKLTSVNIPESVLCIGEDAFGYANKLREVIIPNSVKRIENGAFHASGLEIVDIPGNVEYIGHNVFPSKLKKVTISEGVKSIGFAAFNCSEITEIIIPNSVETLGAQLCSNDISLKTAIIGNGVKVIEDHCFGSCSSLSKVILPSELNRIEHNAFSLCESLKEITIPSSVKWIGSECFMGSALTNITIPDGVEYIGDDAFKDCSTLKTATIPSSIKSLNGGVFSNCSVLTDVYYGGSEEQWNQLFNMYNGNIFEGCNNVTVHFGSTGGNGGNSENNNGSSENNNGSGENNNGGASNESSQSSGPSENGNNPSNSSESSSGNSTVYNSSQSAYTPTYDWLAFNYSDANNFLNNLNPLDEYLYNVDQLGDYGYAAFSQVPWYVYLFGPAAVGLNTAINVYTGSMQEAYLTDPDKTKAILADVIDDMYKNKLSSGELKVLPGMKLSDYISKTGGLAEATGKELTYLEAYTLPGRGDEELRKAAEEIWKNSDAHKLFGGVSTISSFMGTLFAIDDDLKNMMINYDQQMTFLEELESQLTDSTLKKAVSDLKKEYHNTMFQGFVDIGVQLTKQAENYKKMKELTGAASSSSSFSVTDVLDIAKSVVKGEESNTFKGVGKLVLKTVFGKGVGLGFALTDIVTKSISGEDIDAISKMVMSSRIMDDSLTALRNAEQEYQTDRTNVEKEKKFVNIDKLTTSLIAMRYRTMISYYRENGKSDLAEELSKKLNRLTGNYAIGGGGGGAGFR